MGPSHSSVLWPVVVVDDDEVARQLVTRYLTKANLANPIVEMTDGVEACERLASMSVPPVLILLDLEMPSRSGLDVLRWLLGQEHLQQVPVVMLTGSAEIDEVDEAYRLGIASYLVKPVGFAALLDVLRQLNLPWALTPGDAAVSSMSAGGSASQVSP